MIHFPEIFPGPARVLHSNVIVNRYGTELNSADKFECRLLHCVEIHEAVWEVNHEDARSCKASVVCVFRKRTVMDIDLQRTFLKPLLSFGRNVYGFKFYGLLSIKLRA